MKRFILIFAIVLWGVSPAVSADEAISSVKATQRTVVRLKDNNNKLESLQPRLTSALNVNIGGDADADMGDNAAAGAVADNRTQEEKVKDLEKDKLRELKDNASAMKAKEQSDANRLIGGTSIAATGLGGMMLAQGLAEQSADKGGAADMAAYQSTFRCGISNDVHNVKYGEEGSVPGVDLIQMRTDFATLAMKVQDTKTAIGMRPGIESEYEIIRIGDIGQIASNTDGLYMNEAVGKTANRFETAQQRLDSGAAADKVQTGAIIAGAGIAVGAIGNLVANRNAPKESSAEIKEKYKRLIEDTEKIQTEINEIIERQPVAVCPTGATGTYPNCDCGTTMVFVGEICQECDEGKEKETNTTCKEIAKQAPVSQGPVITEFKCGDDDNLITDAANKSCTCKNYFDPVGKAPDMTCVCGLGKVVDGSGKCVDDKKDEAVVELVIRDQSNKSQFVIGKSSFSNDDIKNEVEAWGKALHENGFRGCVYVVGHADTTVGKSGGEAWNKTLSQRRAQTVIDAIKTGGYTGKIAPAVGKGSIDCVPKDKKPNASCRKVVATAYPDGCPEN